MKRPQTFDEIVGNESIKAMLRETIKSAKMRGDALDNIFLSGSSGTGKSTFAGAIAYEFGTNFNHLMCKGCDEEAQIIVMLIMKARDGDIILFDEVHNLKANVIEGTLYDYLENTRVSIQYGNSIASMPAPKVTIIAATTEMDKMKIPFLNRFSIFIRLDKYTHAELAQIIQFNATSENLTLDTPSALKIAQAARGIPRLAIQYLRRVRDHIVSNNITIITPLIISNALALMGIDNYGLSPSERNYLVALYDTFRMRPTGIDSICAVINENRGMMESQYEPTLISTGLIIKTKSGRALTPKGILIADELTKSQPQSI